MWPSTFSNTLCTLYRCMCVCDERVTSIELVWIVCEFLRNLRPFFLSVSTCLPNSSILYHLTSFVILHHFMHFHVHVRNSRGRTYASRPLLPSSLSFLLSLPPNELNCKNKQTTKLLLAHSSQVHQLIFY